jgi:NitT/TauT family transport system substrate-binding protein
MNEQEGKMIRLLFAIFCAALLAGPAVAADKVVLMINWYVYGEHAPFYYGKEKGIFAAEGIDLEIQEGRGSGPTTQAVAARSVQFGYVDVPDHDARRGEGRPGYCDRRASADEPNVGDGLRREEHQEA